MAHRGKLILLLIPVISCHERSSEANLLRPLASAYPSAFATDSIQPQYLRFADPLTASILRNLARNPSYQIAPAGAPLFCPTNPAPGRHGYLIRLRVDAVMGDSAIVAAEQMCSEVQGLISTGIHYLVRKLHGRWELVRPLSGWTSPLAMGHFLPVADKSRRYPLEK